MATSFRNGTAALYLLPGMTAKIKALRSSVELDDVWHEDSEGNFSIKTPIQGFVMDDESVGEMVAVENEPAVLYTHKKFSENTITYYARTGEKSQVCVLAVPIHDHSSIVTGGPAYGTYFTDDETANTED